MRFLELDKGCLVRRQIIDLGHPHHLSWLCHILGWILVLVIHLEALRLILQNYILLLELFWELALING